MEAAIKQCLSCGKPLRGRVDKKFCDDYCRTQFNNQLKAEDSALVKKVNAILRHNRRLLEKQIPAGEEMGKCPKQKLAEAGFNFQYHTHQYTNKKGNVYFFCYEYGYLPLEGDWLLVVKRVEK
jgi:predicted nucleic acid-binding Zn ribbon protein